MKEKSILILLIIFFFAALVPAQSMLVFSGDFNTYFESYPEDTDYESPINPSNGAGLNELMLRQEALFKMEGGNGTDAFQFWTGLNSYPVGSALLAASLDSEGLGTASVMELNSILGETIIGLDLMRLSYSWWTGNLNFTLGRQSFLTGYGYGWNPMDLASPLKDPSDPDADLRGTDAISVSWDSGSNLQLKVYSLLNTNSSGALAWEDVKVGGEAGLLLPFAEIKAAGLWGLRNDDAEYYPSAVSGGILMDILGAGVYGEAVLRRDGRTETVTDTADFILARRDGWIFSALAGLEYYFLNGMILNLEYFYNGEGMNDEERSLYNQALEFNSTSYGVIPGACYSLYRPGYFSRQYLLINLLYSVWDPFQIDFGLTCIASPDSMALSAMPLITIYPTGNLSFRLGYTGMFSFDNGEYNEAWLSPVKHIISLSAGYSF